MANFAYLLDSANEVRKKEGVWVVSGSASVATLPVENALELPISLPWRTDDATGAKFLEIDFGSAVSVNTVAVVNHNITAAATVFRFRGGTTTAPTDVTLELNTDGPGTSANFAAASSSKRYWRLEITDSANPDGYLEVGYLVLGVRTAWTFAFLNEWTRVRRIANRRAGSGVGVAIVGELMNDAHRNVLTFENLHEAEAEELEDWIDSLAGGQTPFLYAPDPDDLRNVYFGRLESPQEIELVRKNKGFTNVSELVLAEDNKGVRIGAI